MCTGVCAMLACAPGTRSEACCVTRFASLIFRIIGGPASTRSTLLYVVRRRGYQALCDTRYTRKDSDCGPALVPLLARLALAGLSADHLKSAIPPTKLVSEALLQSHAIKVETTHAFPRLHNRTSALELLASLPAAPQTPRKSLL